MSVSGIELRLKEWSRCVKLLLKRRACTQVELVTEIENRTGIYVSKSTLGRWRNAKQPYNTLL